MANWWDSLPDAQEQGASGGNWWDSLPDAEPEAPVAQPSKISQGAAALWGLGNGALAGFLGEVEAIQPWNYLRGIDHVKKRFEENNAWEKSASEQHPGASFAGNMVGGLAPALLTGGMALPGTVARGAPMAARMLAGAGAGAGIGALSGAGYSDPGERLQGAATGGVLGGAVGAAAPMVGTAIRSNIIDPIRSRIGQNANKVAGEYASRYLARDSIPTDDIAARMAAMGEGTVPADLGKNTASLAKYVAQKPGAAMTKADEVLGARNEGQQSRVLDAFKSAAGLDADPAAAKGAVVDWEPVLKSKMSVGTDDARLLKLMERPSMKDAWSRAQVIAREEGGKLDDLDKFIGGVKSGQVKAVSTQIMHYLKKGLDDALEPKRDPVTGQVVSDTGKNLLAAQKKNRAEFRDILREKNPAYAEALEKSGEGFRLSESYEQGLDALGMKITDLQKIASRKTGAELDNFRKGFVEAIQHRIATPGEKGHDVTKFLRDPERLETVFGKETADKLMGFMRTEAQKRGTSNYILGGSPTRLLQEVSRDLEQGPAEIPMSIGELIRMGLRSGVSAARRPPEKSLDATARFLFERDPATAQKLLDEMLKSGSFSLPTGTWGRAATAATAQGAGRISAQQR